MRELLDYIFTDIGKDRVFHTVKIDNDIASMKTDFNVTHKIEGEEENKVNSSIVDNFRMLFYQKGRERHYAFSTMTGDTANLITEEVILDMKVYFNNGVALLVPDPIYVQEKGFTKESFMAYVDKLQIWKSDKKVQKRLAILEKFKTVIGFYVYVNENDEAEILDLTNTVCTLYEGQENEKSYSFIKSVVKADDKDEFLCSTYDIDDETDHFWYIDKNTKFLGSVNQKIHDLLGTWDFKVLPGTFDLFLIQKGGKSFLYSYQHNLIYNEFDKEFVVINVLNGNPKDYHTRTLLLLHNHDIDREGQEDLLAFTPLTYAKEEDKGKYIELPPYHIKSIKQIYGLDTLYLITDNPKYKKEDEIPIEEMDSEIENVPSTYNNKNLPYICTLMYMDENNEFMLKELECSSIPSTIYASRKFGVVTLTFKQDVVYNTVSFFHEFGTLYKYSYMEIATSGVKNKIQRQITAKKLEHLKRHLLDTSVTERTSEEEFTQMHNFVKVHVLENRTQEYPPVRNPIIASSYFVDMTSNKPNFDIDRIFVNNVGRYLDFRYVDNSSKTMMRKELSKKELEDMSKRQEIEDEWLKEKLNENKTNVGGI